MNEQKPRADDPSFVGNVANLSASRVAHFVNCLPQTIEATTILHTELSAEVPDQPSDKERQAPTQTSLAPLLGEFALLLANSDFMATVCFSKVKNCLSGSDMSTELKLLEKHMAKFDYEKALILIEKLADKLDISLLQEHR